MTTNVGPLSRVAGNNNNGSVPATPPATAKIPPIYPWPMGNLLVPRSGYGLGNPTTTLERNQAMPWRDQVGLWQFTNAAGVLTLAAGSNVGYFLNGYQEAIPGTTSTGLTASMADTNLYGGGATVPRDYLFAAVAFGVTVGRPFVITGGKRHYPELLYPESPTAGQSYAAILRELMFESLSLRVEYKDSTSSFDLGNISHYPPADGVYGNGSPRLNGGFGVMSMIPILRGPVYLGAQDEVNQPTIIMKSVAQDLVVDAQTVVATADVWVPVRLTAYGDSGPWCGPCAPTQEDIDAIVNARVNAALAARGM